MGDTLIELQASLTIQQSPQRVFELLSSASDLEMWFCEHAEVNLDRGVYSFWGIHTPDTPFRDSNHARLIDKVTDESLSFEWELRGSTSRVDYTLAAGPAGGCLLSVRHSSLSRRADEQAAMHDFWYSTLENLRLLAMTGRMQQMCDYRHIVGPAIEVQIDIAGSAAEVFDKIANPQQIDRYFGENAVVEPVVGGRFDYGWKAGGPISILELEPPTMLVYSWRYDEDYDTVVRWQLAESGGRTRLSLVHSGFPDNYESEGYRSGWFSFLSIIKGMVELKGDWQMVKISGLEHGEA
jgi:uncharacterized protein YndB with AHSA1/START domain